MLQHSDPLPISKKSFIFWPGFLFTFLLGTCQNIRHSAVKAQAISAWRKKFLGSLAYAKSKWIPQPYVEKKFQAHGYYVLFFEIFTDI